MLRRVNRSDISSSAEALEFDITESMSSVHRTMNISLLGLYRRDGSYIGGLRSSMFFHIHGTNV